MSWCPTLAALKNVLALYTSEVDARRMAADTGLDLRFVAFDPKAINTWQHILEEALKANLMDTLVIDIYAVPSGLGRILLTGSLM